jgi:hypothetical protein
LAKLTIEQKKEERLKEWRGWLSEFKKVQNVFSQKDVILIPHAAIVLNDYYWRLADYFLRPLLHYDYKKEHYLHYYKIISASELTTMAVMPFTVKGNDDIADNKKLNANFAMFVASTIMLNWKINGKEIIDLTSVNEIFSYKEIIDVVKKKELHYFLSFKDEHLDWLAGVNTAGPLPVLSNSQTWRLCFLAAKALSNGGKLI